MTTFIPFNPSSVAAPTYQMTLDGTQYTTTLTWNLFAQRYYVNCFDSSGSLVFSVPLIQTAESIPLGSLTWNQDSLQVEATTAAPHGYLVGSVVYQTVEGASPATYNGTFVTFITGLSSFVFGMASDPGLATTVGAVSFLISLCAGYFQSTLVYRNGQFEVNP